MSIFAYKYNYKFNQPLVYMYRIISRAGMHPNPTSKCVSVYSYNNINTCISIENMEIFYQNMFQNTPNCII